MIFKELLQIKKTGSLIQKWEKNKQKQLTKKEIQMIINQMKQCSNVLTEIQIQSYTRSSLYIY